MNGFFSQLPFSKGESKDPLLIDVFWTSEPFPIFKTAHYPL
jgi:hypothetical protein